MLRAIPNIKLLLTIGLYSTATLGDKIVFESRYSSSVAFRAVADSVVHATIGLLSSTLFCSQMDMSNYKSIMNIMFCTMLSSLIDIDHVLVARSFQLKNLTSTETRGIFHCTTFWLILSTSTLIYSYVMFNSNLCILSWMIIIAYTSHHIRDGNRRGLWLYPFGSTNPISKMNYVLLIMLLPHIYLAMYWGIQRAIAKKTVDELIGMVYNIEYV